MEGGLGEKAPGYIWCMLCETSGSSSEKMETEPPNDLVGVIGEHRETARSEEANRRATRPRWTAWIRVTAAVARARNAIML